MLKMPVPECRRPDHNKDVSPALLAFKKKVRAEHKAEFLREEAERSANNPKTLNKR